MRKLVFISALALCAACAREEAGTAAPAEAPSEAEAIQLEGPELAAPKLSAEEEAAVEQVARKAEEFFLHINQINAINCTNGEDGLAARDRLQEIQLAALSQLRPCGVDNRFDLDGFAGCMAAPMTAFDEGLAAIRAEFPACTLSTERVDIPGAYGEPSDAGLQEDADAASDADAEAEPGEAEPSETEQR